LTNTELFGNKANMMTFQGLRIRETIKIALLPKARAAIERIRGNESPDTEHAKVSLPSLSNLRGIGGALKDDLVGGHVATREELIHGEIFSDLFPRSCAPSP
jgi:hypothetical protein